MTTDKTSREIIAGIHALFSERFGPNLNGAIEEEDTVKTVAVKMQVEAGAVRRVVTQLIESGVLSKFGSRIHFAGKLPVE